MEWIFLLIAGAFEVTWATLLKYSDGLSKLWFSVATVICMILSFVFLSKATKTMEIGTAYAVWTGIGALGAVIVGAILFHEQVTLLRAFFVCLLIVGIIGLKFTAGQS